MIVVLFDVDGTLTRGTGAGARALARAFEECYGWKNACAGLRFQGGTDIGLVRTVLLREAVLSPDEATAAEQIDAILRRYVGLLPDEIPRSPYSPLPGAEDLLRTLADEGVAVGLVTGNHPSGAEQKLRSAGLWHHFGFGAYGSESEDRSELVRLALERVPAPRGTRMEHTYVVGDTEYDVRAAHDARARAVAVLTGGVPRETIEAERPFAIFEDLREALRADFWRTP